MLETLQNNFSTILVTTVVGILTALSGYIVEHVKGALNRADLRIERYQTLSTDLSSHVFSVELNQEFFENNWTTEPALRPLVEEYNASITKLRRNEYVYYQWLARYWGAGAVQEFEQIMVVVKSLDKMIHSLNDQFELINITKTQPKMDEARASKVALEMRPLVEELRAKSKAFLTATR